MSRFRLQVVTSMRGGFPSARTITDTDAPAMVKLVKAWIKEKVGTLDFALGIDGGSGQVCDGTKVVALTLLTPKLPFEVLVNLDLLDEHEDAEKQSKFVNRTMTEYGWNKKQAR